MDIYDRNYTSYRYYEQGLFTTRPKAGDVPIAGTSCPIVTAVTG